MIQHGGICQVIGMYVLALPQLPRRARVIRTSVLTLLLLCLGPMSPANAAFPGENGLLAFVREGDVRGIWTLDDFALTRLTHGIDYRPRWSPNGQRIVFQRFSGNHSNIFVMNADGSNLSQLTKRGGFQPAWSSDGTQIVFGSERDGDEDIFTMAADGSDETKLTHDTFDDVTPAWSPDGSRIAYTSRRRHNSDVYLIDPDGSYERRFTRSSAMDASPDWAPDGSAIAFQSRRDGWDIFSKDLDGGRPVQLTRGTASEWAPAWSPDGTKIAYTLLRTRPGVEDIVILDLSTGERLRLTTPGTYDLQPNWQPA